MKKKLDNNVEQIITDKKSVLDILKNSRKKQYLFFFISMIAIFCIYIPIIQMVEKKVNIDKFTKCEISKSYQTISEIENVSIDKDELVMSGWAFRLEVEGKKTFVILRNTKENNQIFCDITDVKREDILTYYGVEQSNSEIGFSAAVETELLEENTSYEILIGILVEEEYGESKIKKVDRRREKISTNQYIYQGELYSYDPLEYEAPRLEDEYGMQIMQDGFLYTYDKSVGVWIYGVENKLFYVLDTSLLKNRELRIEIPIFVYTSCEDFLPDEYKELKKEYFKYMFTETDYINIQEEEYLVVLMEIPKVEYPITMIQTGIYSNTEAKWIWEDFILGKRLQ